MAFDHGESEKPFEEGRIFFEPRDTEGGERKRLEIGDTHQRKMLEPGPGNVASSARG
jgi:hypothetical protein